MDPGEERIIADALFAALSHPGHHDNPPVQQEPTASLAGEWAVTVKYLRGEGQQHFTLTQDGNSLSGHHKGEIYEGRLRGEAHGAAVEIRSRMAVPGNSIDWTFTGTSDGSRIAGTVDMGEYGPASFTAVRA
jgi:hypothetical protein